MILSHLNHRVHSFPIPTLATQELIGQSALTPTTHNGHICSENNCMYRKGFSQTFYDIDTIKVIFSQHLNLLRKIGTRWGSSPTWLQIFSARSDVRRKFTLMVLILMILFLTGTTKEDHNRVWPISISSSTRHLYQHCLQAHTLSASVCSSLQEILVGFTTRSIYFVMYNGVEKAKHCIQFIKSKTYTYSPRMFLS